MDGVSHTSPSESTTTTATKPSTRREKAPTIELESLPKDALLLDLKIFLDSGYENVSLSAKAKDFSYRTELTMSERNWHSLTWGHLKDQLRLKLPGTFDGGELVTFEGRKTFTNNDTLQGLGISGGRSPATFQCVLKLDGTPPQSERSAEVTVAPSASGSAVAPAASSSASSRPLSTQTHVSSTSGVARSGAPKSANTMSTTISDVINVELRIFLNSGYCELQVHASGAFQANQDISIPQAKYSSYTFEQLKKKLGSRCPALKPGGIVAKHTGKESFTDDQTLGQFGIEADESGSTKSFYLTLTKL